MPNISTTTLKSHKYINFYSCKSMWLRNKCLERIQGWEGVWGIKSIQEPEYQPFLYTGEIWSGPPIHWFQASSLVLSITQGQYSKSSLKSGDGFGSHRHNHQNFKIYYKRADEWEPSITLNIRVESLCWGALNSQNYEYHKHSTLALSSPLYNGRSYHFYSHSTIQSVLDHLNLGS